MAAKGELNTAHANLKDAVISGALAQPLQKRANEILARIERPVRLGLLGMPGTGKSTLLNLLLGAEVIPDGVKLPTINLTYGDQAKAVCTLSDGTKKTLDGADMQAISALKPLFIEALLPLPALKKLSMLEVVAGNNTVEQQRAIQWACKRIDIAMWCSAGNFGPVEQELWNHAPENVQDHAFLMLTKTDEAHSNADITARTSTATSYGQDYFKQILPIGTKKAIHARKPDGTVDKDALRSSGGLALISAVLRDVEAGKKAAIDQAHIFLRQIDFTPIEKDPIEPEKSEAEAVEEPEVQVQETAAVEAPEPVQEETPHQEPAPELKAEPEAEKEDTAQEPPVEDVVEVDDAPEETTEPDPESEASDDILAPIDALAADDVQDVDQKSKPKSEELNGTPQLSKASRKAIKQAVDQLTSEGQMMINSSKAADMADEWVIDTCVDSVSWVAEYLTKRNRSEPAFIELRDSAVNAAEIAAKIQSAPDDDTVEDALTLMVQLKQELQASLAA